MHEQIERDVMRTHPDMHFFSGSDGAAVTHRKVRVHISGDVHGRDSVAGMTQPWRLTRGREGVFAGGECFRCNILCALVVSMNEG